MKKEEILKASKEDNKNKDMYGIEVESKACKTASLAMIFLAFIYFTYEIVQGKGSNTALYSLITVFNAILYLYKGIKIENNRKLNIFSASIWSILTIMLILQYFKVI